MKVLLVGCGGVGEAIVRVAKDKPWLERMVLADYSLERARQVQKRLDADDKFPVAQVDARDPAAVAALAREHGADLVMNAVSNFFNNTVFDGAFEGGCSYMDMAMSGTGAGMGSHQFERGKDWERKGLLAILGTGMDPGVSNIFARYAEKHLFDEIDEIGVRDGAAMEIEGYDFATSFSILDTIEECTDEPLVWEKDRGCFTVEPFSGAEMFDFPEGIGPLEVVNIEHEEVVMIPRRIKCRRVTFKYGLGDRFISVIKAIKALGLHRREPVNVGGVRVSPIEVVAACLPQPANLGGRMTGKTCVGTWVTGVKDGRQREVYLYQVTDNQDSMRRYGCQAVSLQTAIGPVIIMELLAHGIWKGKGVCTPEDFDPDPFMERMPKYDFPYGMLEK